jgi:hypothetical protein
MAGLVPAIHALPSSTVEKDVDAGTSPGMTSFYSPLALQLERAFHHLHATAADVG